MATARKVFIFLLILLFMAVAAVFAWRNPDEISVDIGFVRLDGVSTALAFAVVFGLGWVFGLVCASLAMLRLANQRRKLRRRVALAESEVSSLRSLPLQDAH